MKKTFILGLILGSMLVPSMALAQVSTPATTEQVDALKTQLIALLTQMIADLQAQIATIIANQAQQATQIQQIATPVGGAPVQAPVVQVPVVQSPLKVLSINVNEVANNTYEIDVTANRPIDPTLTKIEGKTVVVSDVRTMQVAANCTEPIRSSSQDQIELCNGSRARFNISYESEHAFGANIIFSDSSGGAVTRDVRLRAFR